MNFSKSTWRKTTDINRDHAVFELIHDTTILLDVGFSDSGVLAICFHAGMSNNSVDWNSFFELLDEGRRLAEADH